MIAFLQGMGTGAGLIIAIGAQNAHVLAQGVRREHNWLVAAVCSFCDAALIFLGAAGVGTLVAQNPLLRDMAGYGGAVFLFLYGCRALRSAYGGGVLQADERLAGQTRLAVLVATLAVTLLNPHVYLDTVLLIGSLGAQQAAPGAYAMGAASASLIWFFTLAFGAAWLAPWLARPATWRLVDLMVAVMMLGMAAQLVFAN